MKKREMIKLVIFDLDGTLLNSVTDLGNSCNYILKKYGYPVHPLESYKYFVGNGVGKLVERALPEDKRDPEYVEKIRIEFVEYYSKHASEATAPYYHITDLLASLEKANILIAVASNKFESGTKSLVAQYFSDFKWAAIYGQREGIPPKPDPRIIEDILDDLQITDKTEVLYLGDTATDMQTCKNAGITSIGVSWGFRTIKELQDNEAEYIINDPLELLDIIENINK